MRNLHLRPAQPDRDFAPIAALFIADEIEATSEADLLKDYESTQARILRLMVAEDEQGELLGFNWATRSRHDPAMAHLYLIVNPACRGQGVGSRLYADLEQAVQEAQIRQVLFSIRDDCPPCKSFAERRGFHQHNHIISMALDLIPFDDKPYDATLARLQEEGFQFTSMADLGNGEEAQRMLYALNDQTAMDVPESTGQHVWPTFEDFQQRVCQAGWYNPAGQMVVIDTANGAWAAMSAITRFEGIDGPAYAYNLHTGVDRRYRGRKLAQAVKLLALRFAREVLQVTRVQTHHDERNLPMIAIDRKFGYVQTLGSYQMEKVLE